MFYGILIEEGFRITPVEFPYPLIDFHLKRIRGAYFGYLRSPNPAKMKRGGRILLGREFAHDIRHLVG